MLLLEVKQTRLCFTNVKRCIKKCCQKVRSLDDVDCKFANFPFSEHHIGGLFCGFSFIDA